MYRARFFADELYAIFEYLSASWYCWNAISNVYISKMVVGLTVKNDVWKNDGDITGKKKNPQIYLYMMYTSWKWIVKASEKYRTSIFFFYTKSFLSEKIKFENLENTVHQFRFAFIGNVSHDTVW